MDLAWDVLEWIDLDPFSNAGSITAATTQWHGPDCGNVERRGDGFEDSWCLVPSAPPPDHRRVWFNPPWNKSGKAVRKAVVEYEQHIGRIEIIGLFPCSMNAKHWPLVEQAPARCYLNRRPSFLEGGEEKKGNPKDVAIVYWGHRPYRFADVFSSIGRIHFGMVGDA
jgi:hypothetical protein